MKHLHPTEIPPREVVRSMSPTMLKHLDAIAQGEKVTNQQRVEDLADRILITFTYQHGRKIPANLTDHGERVLKEWKTNGR